MICMLREDGSELAEERTGPEHLNSWTVPFVLTLSVKISHHD